MKHSIERPQMSRDRFALVLSLVVLFAFIIPMAGFAIYQADRADSYRKLWLDEVRRSAERDIARSRMSAVGDITANTLTNYGISGDAHSGNVNLSAVFLALPEGHVVSEPFDDWCADVGNAITCADRRCDFRWASRTKTSSVCTCGGVGDMLTPRDNYEPARYPAWTQEPVSNEGKRQKAAQDARRVADSLAYKVDEGAGTVACYALSVALDDGLPPINIPTRCER